ncbi:MAG: hypothetical protein ABS84_08135 [Rubrivivax sp. SCN 71-131]|jgi:hypothetical protein|nr:MAG: hypothetical protein ABS84_08135 [Rubrivivax sp. SCN 71-131]
MERRTRLIPLGRRQRPAVPALAALAALAVLSGCASAPPPDKAWQGQARQVATAVPPKLLAVLQAEIARGGPAGAVEVCRDKAPAMARAASAESGWTIRRVSLRNRNPKAVPDDWERGVLEDFDRRAAAGEPAATLERAEIVSEGGRSVQRYMRALPTQEFCTQCHGTPDRISPAVAAKLAQTYPQDRATGYQVGQIRGAMTLQRPAP